MSHFFVRVCVSCEGVTPVDATPSQPYSDCYPVLLDGALVGWVEKELAPALAESLRRFKVSVFLRGIIRLSAKPRTTAVSRCDPLNCL